MMLISTADLGEYFVNEKCFQYVNHWYPLTVNIENWQQVCLESAVVQQMKFCLSNYLCEGCFCTHCLSNTPVKSNSRN
jgi:hypothetical protein